MKMRGAALLKGPLHIGLYIPDGIPRWKWGAKWKYDGIHYATEWCFGVFMVVWYKKGVVLSWDDDGMEK